MADRDVKVVYEIIDKATDKLESIEKSTSKLDIISAAAFINIAKQALSAAKSIGDFAIAGLEATDAIGDMSKRTGVAIDTIVALELAAVQSGSSLAEVEVGLRTLANQAEAANRGVGEAQRIFVQLGIAVTDAQGNLKTTGALLPEIADKFARMGNATERTALATDLFGRSGTALIPFLSQGREGLANLEIEARKLGLTFSDSTAKAADQVSDALAVSKLQVTALGRELGIFLLPSINFVIEAFRNLVATFTKQETLTLSDEVKVLGERYAAVRAQLEANDKTGLLFAATQEKEKGLRVELQALLGKELAIFRELGGEKVKDIAFSKAVQDADARSLLTMLQSLDADIRSLEAKKERKAASDAARASLVAETEAQEEATLSMAGLREAMVETSTVTLATLATEREARLDAFDKFVNEQKARGTILAGAEETRFAILTEFAAKRAELERAELDFTINEIEAKRIANIEQRHQQERALLEQRIALEKLSDFDAAKRKIELAGKQRDQIITIQQQQATALVSIGEKVSDVFSAQEKDRGNALKAFLKDFVRAKVKELAVFGAAEIGKATAAGPLSLGFSLLAIPLIAAAIAGADAVLNSIAFAKGGRIPGFGGGDTVPIMAERGEFVVNKQATAMFEPQLAAMNSRGLGMQDGGLVTGGAGVTVNIGRVEVTDAAEFLKRLNEWVQFRGGRLVATEVLA